MQFPFLKAQEQTSQMNNQFGGYNHKTVISGNEFFDMENMASDEFPLAVTRKKRGKLNITSSSDTLANAIGIKAKEKMLLAYTQQGSLGITTAESVGAGEAGAQIVNGNNYSYLPYAASDATVFINAFGGASTTLYDYTNDTLNLNKSFTAIGRYNGNAYIKRPHAELPINSKLVAEMCTVAAVPDTTATAGWTTYKANATGSGTATILVTGGYAQNDTIMNALLNKQIAITTYNSTISRFTVTNVSTYGSKSSTGTEFTTSWTGRLLTLSYTAGAFVASIDASGTSPSKIYMPVFNSTTRALRSCGNDNYTYLSLASNTNLQLVNPVIGTTITNGSNTYNVKQIASDDIGIYMAIEKPHAALSTGVSFTGNRLYLAERNPSEAAPAALVGTNICAAAAGKHQIVEMGAYVCIFPEKVRVNTVDRDSNGYFTDVSLMEVQNAVSGDCQYQLCDINGNTFTTGTKSNTAPEEPNNGDAWIDDSTSPPTLKVYSSSTAVWVKTEPYVQISSSSIFTSWQVGDAVSLEFADETNLVLTPNQTNYIISAVGTAGDEYIRIPMMAKTTSAISGGVTIKRTVPDMDYIVECDNRLWGCKYGMVDGKMLNEIFACKQGDATNWNYFANTALDSYYVSLGSDGAFTGAATAGSPRNPIFFKENGFHRVYGNYPANYSVKFTECTGIAPGSDMSTAIVNGTLYYLSSAGVMTYDGTFPFSISDNLGQVKYQDAISGAVGNKLYISLSDGTTRSLFVYDTYYRTWHKEDDLDVTAFESLGGELYALTSDNNILSMTGQVGTLESDFSWMMQTGNIGYSSPNHKIINKVILRFLMNTETTADMAIQYDSSGNWEPVSLLSAVGVVRSLSVPIHPRRCDHFALKISGKGLFKLLSTTQVLEDGSDVS